MSEIEPGKYIFGMVKVGERGQVVIPASAREKFGINPGDNLIVIGDEDRGIMMVDVSKMKSMALKILEGLKEFE
jgi:AbrB family looped-hinge helix DNA binding protein